MKQFMIFVALSLVLGCSSEKQEHSPISQTPPIDQGVYGRVEFWEGDFMPVIDPEHPQGSISFVEREIFVYEKTTFDDVVMAQDGGFYSEVKTVLEGKTTSDKDGRFELALPVGIYSLFVKENGLFYANGTSAIGPSENYIWPIEIVENNLTEYMVKITHAATF